MFLCFTFFYCFLCIKVSGLKCFSCLNAWGSFDISCLVHATLLTWTCTVSFHRAGELSAAEIDSLMVIVANPRQFKIPDWFLNRKKDYKDGKFSQVTSNALDMKLRDDLERLKKIRCAFSLWLFFLNMSWLLFICCFPVASYRNHRGLRHYWGLRVRGQHTKTTGRRGKTVGVSKKR